MGENTFEESNKNIMPFKNKNERQEAVEKTLDRIIEADKGVGVDDPGGFSLKETPEILSEKIVAESKGEEYAKIFTEEYGDTDEAGAVEMTMRKQASAALDEMRKNNPEFIKLEEKHKN